MLTQEGVAFNVRNRGEQVRAGNWRDFTEGRNSSKGEGIPTNKQKSRQSARIDGFYGGDKWARTIDLSRVKRAL